MLKRYILSSLMIAALSNIAVAENQHTSSITS